MNKLEITPQDNLALQIIDQWLAYRVSTTDLPGLQISIRKKGSLLFSKAYGYANLETGERLTPKHLGHIASQSKMFTSATLLRLCDKGVLTLEDKLVAHLPELAAHKDKRFREIRLQDLLFHRSGLFRDGLRAPHWELEAPFFSREEVIAETLKADLVFTPRTVTKYSNMDYALLGIAMERATGKTYAKLVTDEVLRPLGLKNIQSDFAETKGKEFAQGHTRVFYEGARHLIPHTPANALAPAVGFCATADSLALFVESFLAKGDFLSKKMRLFLNTQAFPVEKAEERAYGTGLQIEPFGSTQLQGHSGVYTGFVSATMKNQTSGLTVSFIVNSDFALSYLFWRDLMENIHGLFDTVGHIFPGKHPKVEMTPPVFYRNFTGILLLGPQKAIGFNFDRPLLFKGWPLTFEKGAYYAKENTGYSTFGEPLCCLRNKAGKIVGVQDGAMVYRARSAFEKLTEKTGTRIRNQAPKSFS